MERRCSTESTLPRGRSPAPSRNPMNYAGTEFKFFVSLDEGRKLAPAHDWAPGGAHLRCVGCIPGTPTWCRPPTAAV